MYVWMYVSVCMYVWMYVCMYYVNMILENGHTVTLLMYVCIYYVNIVCMNIYVQYVLINVCIYICIYTHMYIMYVYYIMCSTFLIWNCYVCKFMYVRVLLTCPRDVSFEVLAVLFTKHVPAATEAEGVTGCYRYRLNPTYIHAYIHKCINT